MNPNDVIAYYAAECLRLQALLQQMEAKILELEQRAKDPGS